VRATTPLVPGEGAKVVGWVAREKAKVELVELDA
jgi:hypothetical protein